MAEEYIRKGFLFAEMAHEGQVRKYTGKPYVTHPQAVANLVSEVTDNIDMIVAALLHDVVEDTEFTFDDLLEEGFTERTVQLVRELTEFTTIKDGNRQVRKALDARYLARASNSAKTIKLADIIHNSISIVKEDPGFAVIYMKEKRALLNNLKEGNSYLFNIANNILKEYYKK